MGTHDLAVLAAEAAGHLPEEGEVVEVDGYRLEVLERLGTRILRVRIRPPARQVPDPEPQAP
ncbi:hypothetical protein HRbin39_01227 [bacterium HR39]|nr:hypothetical protein HRbin39_01227 [bacterium HR39]